MPTGHGLKGEIARALAFRVNDFREIVGGDATIREAIYRLAQRPNSIGNVDDYIRTARHIHDAMPQAPSIDNFVDSHRGNQKIAECGKLAIASQILKAERASKLFVDPSNVNNKIKFESVEDTWFQAFFDLMARNSQFEQLSRRFGRVAVVSFNYDRTLEHFLHQSIQNFYGSSPEDATHALTSLVVLHPYGKVGDLPWQSPNGETVPYGAELQPTALLQVASSLRTFPEGTDPSGNQIAEIRFEISSAETLVFLGFAYHELNLDVLFSNDREVPIEYSKRVLGTAKWLSVSNTEVITRELAAMGRIDQSQINLERELTAAELLRHFSKSLTI